MPARLHTAAGSIRTAICISPRLVNLEAASVSRSSAESRRWVEPFMGIRCCAVENLTLAPNLFPGAIVFDTGQHQMCGVNVKAVAIVNFFDKVLNQLVIKR